jgi:thiol-disulfide isomerase/thioredoxin
MVQPGKFAPDFELYDTEGITRSLSDAIKGAEYLLLDFWASTCGPCRLENPHILKAYENFHSKGPSWRGSGNNADQFDEMK